MHTETAPDTQSNEHARRTADGGGGWPSTANSHPIMGYISAYVPEELLHAAGFTPIYGFHTPQDQGRTRAHLPTFTCWAGSALDQALAGQLDGLRDELGLPVLVVEADMCDERLYNEGSVRERVAAFLEML